MPELIFIIVILLADWVLIKYLGRDVQLETARTKGFKVVREHLHNPVLLEEYAESRGIAKEAVVRMVKQGKIVSYRRHQYIFVDSDADR
jgi:hypothetical protein